MDTSPTPDPARAIADALARARAGLVERDALVETIALAAVAGEHVLVIGPPGTAKSEAARRVARALGGTYFEYLLGRFTEPGEIFGPVDLRRLREGVVETETAGMLPEAEIAFLDEVFLGSTAILNTLLGILNERTFRRGHTIRACPLRLCVGASNALPDDPSLAAFADRFLVRAFLDPIPDPRLEELLEGGWNLATPDDDRPVATLADLDALAAAARAADLSRVRPALAHALRRLRSAGIHLTDRRAVRVQKLIAAAAALAGRAHPTDADLWPLALAIPTADQQALARDTLGDLLIRSENATLPAAAEDASRGPAARAGRLLAAAHAALAVPPDPTVDPEIRNAWRLRLEGIARETDATLAPEQIPADLAAARADIARILGAP